MQPDAPLFCDQPPDPDPMAARRLFLHRGPFGDMPGLVATGLRCFGCGRILPLEEERQIRASRLRNRADSRPHVLPSADPFGGIFR
jgi:hypothetical protein